MVFSSTIFILVFLPATLLFYYLFSLIKCGKYKNIILLISSIVFYAWGGIKYLIFLLILIFFNYLFAVLMGRYPKYRKQF